MSISVKDVSFRYRGANSWSLSHVSLAIPEKSFVTMTGPSGGGKSTLALAMTGFIPHSYSGEMLGEVIVGGIDTLSCQPVSLSGTIGMVRQDPEAQLCTLTVMDEVAFGPENLRVPPSEIAERVRNSLQICGAAHLIDRDVYTLSGGEKQRVALASILATSPKIILLDEPTANLDPKGTKDVLEALTSLHKQAGTSIVVIEHRLQQLLRLSDTLIQLNDGKATVYDKVSLEIGSSLESKYPKRRVKKITDTSQALLSIDHLCVHRGERTILKDLSFSVYPGEIVALMGDNGSGKSTLLSAIMGLIRPTYGRVMFGTKDVRDMPTSKRAVFAGLSFQNPNHQVSESTVMRELMLTAQGLGRKPSGNLQDMLNKFGLAECGNKSPFSLSMGQKKRLNLISLLAYDRKLLLLDEPFTGQDGGMVDIIMDQLLAHAENGGATIMVCHQPEIVDALCSRAMFLQDGKIHVDDETSAAFAALESEGRNEYTPQYYGKGEHNDT
jgi:energy-coupling factor transporter ATP-binding protein EcfA2